jgi:uncharacterized membrane protein
MDLWGTLRMGLMVLVMIELFQIYHVGAFGNENMRLIVALIITVAMLVGAVFVNDEVEERKLIQDLNKWWAKKEKETPKAVNGTTVVADKSEDKRVGRRLFRSRSPFK